MPRSRAFSVLAALLVSVAGSALLPMTSSASTRDVTAWVELSSTRPGPGCDLYVSIEVRDAGVAVSNAEASIALFAGDEPVAIDREITDGSGVAKLVVNTSGIGADGWLDINVAGSYLKGYSIGATDGNGCDAASKYDVVEGSIASAASSSSAFPPYYTYQQQRNLSCEYAAIQIATNGAVSEYDIESVIGHSENPHWGYRGDINGAWGNTTDYGIYPEPLSAGLADFGYVGEVIYGGYDTSALTSRLDQGVPVLVWVALWGDLSEVLTTDDGTSYTVTAGMHVMVAYDYDESNIYLSDPGSGSLVAFSWGSFVDKWGVLDGMALAVYPA